MDGKHCARVLVLAPLVASGLALSGCMSSPTYGTDKTANEQLMEDLSGAMTLAPPKRAAIDYKPRPPLVKPAPGQKEALPPPQDDIVQTASAQWPESPEQRRARIRDYATQHRDDPNFEPEVVNDGSGGIPVASRPPTAMEYARNQKGERAEFNKRLKENRQGDPTTRKYLSEPPLVYREAAATAPQGDIGEDEYKKERRLKAAAKGKKSLFDWWPW
jgi:hypothetical protein